MLRAAARGEPRPVSAKVPPVECARQRIDQSLLDVVSIEGPGAAANLEDERVELVAKLGENIEVVGAERYELGDGEVAADYIHPPARKIGVLVRAKASRELARMLAMHIAAARPRYLTRDEIPEHEIAEERAVYEKLPEVESKPEDVRPKIVEGRPGCAEGAEVVLVLGGDGTVLRAAELARPTGVPLLGVNLGHYGFLAEAEEEFIAGAVDAIACGHYAVEERMTIDAVARRNGDVLARTWALNEAAIEKSTRERILEVVLEVDGRPVSAFGCDGVLCSTPTGSTAYAFSAGGPIVWPQVQALLLIPSNAHALFARPMVIAPDSQVAIEVQAGGSPAVLDCDGRRTAQLPPGARVEVTQGVTPVRMVRLDGRPSWSPG